jgi:hypothetical protein
VHHPSGYSVVGDAATAGDYGCVTKQSFGPSPVLGIRAAGF